MPTKKQAATATAEAPTEATPKPARKPRAKKTPLEAPKCSCGKVLDWRDRAYGKGGSCKRCTERLARLAARGTFIGAATYCAVIESRQHIKTRKHHQTALRDLPARERQLVLRKRGKAS